MTMTIATINKIIQTSLRQVSNEGQRFAAASLNLQHKTRMGSTCEKWLLRNQKWKEQG